MPPPAVGPAETGRDWSDRQAILDRNLFQVSTLLPDEPVEEPAVDEDAELEATRLPLKLLGTVSATDPKAAWAAVEDTQSRFGLTVHGTKGVVQMTTGSLPPVYFLDDPSWFPGRSKKGWQEVTSNGVGKPETIKDNGLGLGNIWIVKDLIAAVEQDRQPLGSVYDARAALEMILAVYESHRAGGPVELPLKERRHPLTLL